VENNIKEEESNFHDSYVSDLSVRKFESLFYCDLARGIEDAITFTCFGDLHGKNVLFYGSGAHYSLVKKFHDLGAKVLAIDISPKTVDKLNSAIMENGLTGTCEARVMDCEDLEIIESSYDFVFARSIIHHLVLKKSIYEISKVLKSGGIFCALEPLGTNPVINLYRKFTPNSRTSGEKPFKNVDITLIENSFETVDITYLYFFSIIAYFYRILDKSESRFETLFLLLHRLDKKILAFIPILRCFYWDAFFCCKKK
jgi:SAM-dependent methyltransferase